MIASYKNIYDLDKRLAGVGDTTGINRVLGLDSIEEYDTTTGYVKGDVVKHEDIVYRALYNTTGEWDMYSWEKVNLLSQYKPLNIIAKRFTVEFEDHSAILQSYDGTPHISALSDCILGMKVTKRNDEPIYDEPYLFYAVNIIGTTYSTEEPFLESVYKIEVTENGVALDNGTAEIAVYYISSSEAQ